MLERPAPGDEEILDAYATYIARYMPARINVWERPIEPEHVDKFAACFRALRSYFDDSRHVVEWYSHRPFVP
jgi:hypothetical protein